jgi:predicted transcriptional regulator
MNTRNYKLIQMLDETGLNQGALARKSGINETRLSRIVRGYVDPAEDEIVRICKALKMGREALGLASAASRKA